MHRLYCGPPLLSVLIACVNGSVRVWPVQDAGTMERCMSVVDSVAQFTDTSACSAATMPSGMSGCRGRHCLSHAATTQWLRFAITS